MDIDPKDAQAAGEQSAVNIKGKGSKEAKDPIDQFEVFYTQAGKDSKFHTSKVMICDLALAQPEHVWYSAEERSIQITYTHVYDMIGRAGKNASDELQTLEIEQTRIKDSLESTSTISVISKAVAHLVEPITEARNRVQSYNEVNSGLMGEVLAKETQAKVAHEKKKFLLGYAQVVPLVAACAEDRTVDLVSTHWQGKWIDKGRLFLKNLAAAEVAEGLGGQIADNRAAAVASQSAAAALSAPAKVHKRALSQQEGDVSYSDHLTLVAVDAGNLESVSVQVPERNATFSELSHQIVNPVFAQIESKPAPVIDQEHGRELQEREVAAAYAPVTQQQIPGDQPHFWNADANRFLPGPPKITNDRMHQSVLPLASQEDSYKLFERLQMQNPTQIQTAQLHEPVRSMAGGENEIVNQWQHQTLPAAISLNPNYPKLQNNGDKEMIRVTYPVNQPYPENPSFQSGGQDRSQYYPPAVRPISEATGGGPSYEASEEGNAVLNALMSTLPNPPNISLFDTLFPDGNPYAAYENNMPKLYFVFGCQTQEEAAAEAAAEAEAAAGGVEVEFAEVLHPQREAGEHSASASEPTYPYLEGAGGSPPRREQNLVGDRLLAMQRQQQNASEAEERRRALMLESRKRHAQNLPDNDAYFSPALETVANVAAAVGRNNRPRSSPGYGHGANQFPGQNQQMGQMLGGNTQTNPRNGDQCFTPENPVSTPLRGLGAGFNRNADAMTEEQANRTAQWALQQANPLRRNVNEVPSFDMIDSVLGTDDRDDLNFVMPSPPSIRAIANTLNMSTEHLELLLTQRQQQNTNIQRVQQIQNPRSPMIATTHGGQMNAGGQPQGGGLQYPTQGMQVTVPFEELQALRANARGVPVSFAPGYPGGAGTGPTGAEGYYTQQPYQGQAAPVQQYSVQPGYASQPIYADGYQRVNIEPGNRPLFPKPPVYPAKDKPINPFKFGGKVEKVAQFVYQANAYAQHVLAQNPEMSTYDVLSKISLFLEGEAFDWWAEIMHQGGPAVVGYHTLEEFFVAFRSRFVTKIDSANARRSMATLKQKDLSVQSLAIKFKELARMVALHQGEIDHTTQTQMFTECLNPNLRAKLEIASVAIPGIGTNLDIMIQTCVTLEQNMLANSIRKDHTQEKTNEQHNQRDRSPKRQKFRAENRTNVAGPANNVRSPERPQRQIADNRPRPDQQRWPQAPGPGPAGGGRGGPDGGQWGGRGRGQVGYQGRHFDPNHRVNEAARKAAIAAGNQQHQVNTTEPVLDPIPAGGPTFGLKGGKFTPCHRCKSTYHHERTCDMDKNDPRAYTQIPKPIRAARVNILTTAHSSFPIGEGREFLLNPLSAAENIDMPTQNASATNPETQSTQAPVTTEDNKVDTEIEILYACGRNGPRRLTMSNPGMIAGRQGPRTVIQGNGATSAGAEGTIPIEAAPATKALTRPDRMKVNKLRMQATPIEDQPFAKFRKTNFLFDSGASDTFASVAVAKEILALNPDLKLIKSKRMVQVADGSLKPELGRIPVTFGIGLAKLHWEVSVAELGDDYDVILGQDFLDQFGVILDYHRHQIRIMRVPGRGFLKIKVSSGALTSHLNTILRTERKVHDVLSAVQFCRDFRPGERMFLMHADPQGRLIPPELVEQLKKLPKQLQSATADLICNHIRTVPNDHPVPVTDGPYSPDINHLTAADAALVNAVLLTGVGIYDNVTVEEKLEKVPTHMRQMVGKYMQVFEDLPDHLPPIRKQYHAIPLEPGAIPPPHKMYRLSPKEKEEVEFQLRSLIKKGYVTPSHSPFGAPILFKDKPDGSFRMCVDFRALNKQTIKNRFPLPRMDELLDMLTKAKYFTSLDLQQAYNQVQLLPEDREKTAFVTHLGLYEYKVLCFGLANAPATFQSLMNESLQGLLYKNVVAYLDDILIFSEDEEEHVAHVEEVLKRLKRDHYYCRIWKCDFSKTKIKFLGWIIEAGTRSPDPSKVKIVDDWPRPVTGEQVRSFLGLSGWFREYIWQYAKIAEPLQALIRKPIIDKSKPKAKAKFAPFEWNLECEKSFQALKRSLTDGPVLALPDMSQPFTVVTDASQYGVGCILLQGNRPVCFGGRALTAVERRWSVGDRELYGVIYALKNWRHYLDGFLPFTVITDHNPNIYFAQKTILSGKQARWAEFLEGFDFTWLYEPGKTNCADPLSRSPQFASLLYALASVPKHEDGARYLESRSRLGAITLYEAQLHLAVATRSLARKDTIRRDQNTLPESVLDDSHLEQAPHVQHVDWLTPDSDDDTPEMQKGEILETETTQNSTESGAGTTANAEKLTGKKPHVFDFLMDDGKRQIVDPSDTRLQTFAQELVPQERLPGAQQPKSRAKPGKTTALKDSFPGPGYVQSGLLTQHPEGSTVVEVDERTDNPRSASAGRTPLPVDAQGKHIARTMPLTRDRSRSPIPIRLDIPHIEKAVSQRRARIDPPTHTHEPFYNPVNETGKKDTRYVQNETDATNPICSEPLLQGDALGPSVATGSRDPLDRTSERVGQGPASTPDMAEMESVPAPHITTGQFGIAASNKSVRKTRKGKGVGVSDRVLRTRDRFHFDVDTLLSDQIPAIVKHLPNAGAKPAKKNRRRKGFGGVGVDWNQERQFDSLEFRSIEVLLDRKFTLDGCSCDGGANALVDSYCCPTDSFFNKDLCGEFTWINPPFNNLKAFLDHYLACKARSPSNTSACIVLPDWDGTDWNELVRHMKLIRGYKEGTELFWDSDGKLMPGTPWGIRVYYDPPRKLFSNDFTDERVAGTPETVQALEKEQKASPLDAAAAESMVLEGYETDKYFQTEVNTRHLEMLNGYWWKKGALVIPDIRELKDTLLHEVHEANYAGHPGVTRSMQLLVRQFWWPGMHAEIAAYVKSCPKCQANKSRNQKRNGHLMPLEIPSRAWDEISMDFITCLPTTRAGYDAILVVVDRLTKMAHFIPCVTKCTGEQVAKMLWDHVFKYHGLPRQIVADRDVRWTSEFWTALGTYMGTQLALSTAFHPQTDGQTERMNRVLEETLRHYVDPTQLDWDDNLAAAEFAINNATSGTTGNTPFFLNTGYHPRTPLSDLLPSFQPVANYVKNQKEAIVFAKECMDRAQQRYATNADVNKTELKLVVGDKVYLETVNLPVKAPGAKKMLPKYIGPFHVLEIINPKAKSPVAFRLDIPEAMGIHPVFHISLLKKYIPRLGPDGQEAPPTIPILKNGVTEWIVLAVLNHRVNRRYPKDVKKMEFLIRWKGMTFAEDEWIPYKNMQEAQATISDYFRRRDLQWPNQDPPAEMPDMIV